MVHVLDASGIEGRDPVEDYSKIREELLSYSMELANRPEIIAANKCDLPDAEAGIELLEEQLEGLEIVPISAVTRDGVKELLRRVADKLETLPEAEVFTDNENAMLDQRIDESVDIFKDGDTYYVEGGLSDRLIDMLPIRP